MRLGKIQAILFDLGDTLINFGPLRIFEIFEQASQKSYDYLKKMNQPVGGFQWYHFLNANAIRLRLLMSFFSGNDFDSLEALKFYGKQRGFSLNHEQWEELNWHWYRPLVDLASVEDDLAGSLQVLKDMELELGIVSNTFVNGTSLDRHLEIAGILEFFPMRLYSYEMTCRKPDRRIFEEAAKRIDAAPDRILFVGDRINKDVEGALKVGMIPVLKRAYTNKGKTVPEGVHVIERISELADIVRSYNGQEEPAEPVPVE